MNGCFNLFHENLDNSTPRYDVRNHLSDIMYKNLTKYIPSLNSPTISIHNENDLLLFLKNNPKFNLYPRTYLDLPINNKYHLKEPIYGWHYEEIGIWASNYLAWKNFIESNYDYLLLLEDDLVIEDNFFDIFNSTVNELPKDWDVYFHHLSNSKLLSLIPVESNIKFFRPQKTVDHNAYAISKSGAIKSINEIENGLEIKFPCDWFFFNRKHNYNVYTLDLKSPKGCRVAMINSSFRQRSPRQDLTESLKKVFLS